MGCPIRTPSDQSLLAAPRGLSQPITSFIVCNRQGIHRTPLSCLIHRIGCPTPCHEPPPWTQPVKVAGTDFHLRLQFLYYCLTNLIVILKITMLYAELSFFELTLSQNKFVFIYIDIQLLLC